MVSLEFNQKGSLICRLQNVNGGLQEQSVYIKKCFPWSSKEGDKKENFFSLKNFDDEEVYLIENLEDLGLTSQNAIKSYFEFNELKLEILKVNKIEESFELRLFDVETSQGPRKFQMKLEDYPEGNNSGAVFFEDLSGDLFYVSDANLLDEDSRKKLSYLID